MNSGRMYSDGSTMCVSMYVRFLRSAVVRTDLRSYSEQRVTHRAILREQDFAARGFASPPIEFRAQRSNPRHLLARRRRPDLAPVLDDELVDLLVLEVEHGPELLVRDRL